MCDSAQAERIFFKSFFFFFFVRSFHLELRQKHERLERSVFHAPWSAATQNYHLTLCVRNKNAHMAPLVVFVGWHAGV